MQVNVYNAYYDIYGAWPDISVQIIDSNLLKNKPTFQISNLNSHNLFKNDTFEVNNKWQKCWHLKNLLTLNCGTW